MATRCVAKQKHPMTVSDVIKRGTLLFWGKIDSQIRTTAMVKADSMIF
jgi:hypothetical protein